MPAKNRAKEDCKSFILVSTFVVFVWIVGSTQAKVDSLEIFQMWSFSLDAEIFKLS
jgi:hypothetical protein